MIAFRWYTHLHLTAIVMDLFSRVRLISPNSYISLPLISKAFMAEEATTSWFGFPWLDSPFFPLLLPVVLLLSLPFALLDSKGPVGSIVNVWLLAQTLLDGQSEIYTIAGLDGQYIWLMV